MTRMVMNFVPQEIKEEYLEPIFDYICENAAYGIDSLIGMPSLASNFFEQNFEL